MLVLMIPVLGLMHLDQYRLSLIAAELDALRTQGKAFALSLGSTAVVGTQFGNEQLLPEMARHLMRVLLIESGVRARIFAPSGKMLADSFALAGPGGLVQNLVHRSHRSSPHAGRKLKGLCIGNR